MTTFLLEYIPRWQVPGINQETVGEQTSDVVMVFADREELPHFGPPKLSVYSLNDVKSIHPTPEEIEVFSSLPKCIWSTSQTTFDLVNIDLSWIDIIY